MSSDDTLNENKEEDTENGFTSLKDGSTNSTAIAAYYDEWAETYDVTLKNWDYQAPADVAKTLCEYLKPGDSVLDVGCGTGMFGKALSGRLDCLIEGIDISSASLEKAEEQNWYRRLQRHDLQVSPLPVADNAFEAAACVGVMTYIEDAPSLFVDLCRIVRAGGYIVFTQRDDLWQQKDFSSLLDDLEKRKLWKTLSVSNAVPYLPKNDEFSDTIGVIQVLCKVI
ncbi:MAG: methyltransferase domain-containing protein [Sneathiella sp.]